MRAHLVIIVRISSMGWGGSGHGSGLEGQMEKGGGRTIVDQLSNLFW